MREVREREESAVIFYVDTIADRRIEGGAELRNHPIVANNPDQSPAVRSEVEAVQQQWADSGQ